MKNIKLIGFDADDTLWQNETFYRGTEKEFCALLAAYMPSAELEKELFATEMRNLSAYGFGAKSFVLSMIETAVRVSGGKVSGDTVQAIVELGKKLLDSPLELLDGVEPVLAELGRNYRLAVVTKGDLLDQQRKLHKSGVAKYFDHVEILSDKTELDYKNLFARLGVRPQEFLMVGNSLKSDILPVLGMGSFGVHIPFDVVWQHERVESDDIRHENFRRIARISELPALLR